MKTLAYLGADPGLSGAIALYVLDVQHRVIARDMPTLNAGVGGKRIIDMWALSDQLHQWADDYAIKQAIVERVHSMPAQGVASSFSFGFAAGSLQQAIASAKIPMTLISPATWKISYGLRGGRENKDMSRAKASQLFPAFADQWARKKDDGRAEAVLLAHYGSRLP